MRYFAVGVFVLCLSRSLVRSEDPPTKLTDAEITKLLLGKWTVEKDYGNGLKLKISTCFLKDGTVEYVAVAENGEKTRKLAVSSTWKVSDGVIVSTVTKTGDPESFKVGDVIKEPVFSINDRVLKIKAKDKEMQYNRIKE